MNNDLWTLQEVARYLRVSKNTVYAWAKQGTIPAAKVGKQWRFSKPKVTRWANDRHSNEGSSHAPALSA